jgi:Wiskott-Aldrich syndrome protein
MLIYGDDERLAAWIGEQLGARFSPPYICIGIVRNGTLAAACLYNNFNLPDVQMTIASTSPRWSTRQVIARLFSYPFLELGCGRVSALTRVHNQLARGTSPASASARRLSPADVFGRRRGQLRPAPRRRNPMARGVCPKAQTAPTAPNQMQHPARLSRPMASRRGMGAPPGTGGGMAPQVGQGQWTPPAGRMPPPSVGAPVGQPQVGQGLRAAAAWRARFGSTGMAPPGVAPVMPVNISPDGRSIVGAPPPGGASSMMGMGSAQPQPMMGPAGQPGGPSLPPGVGGPPGGMVRPVAPMPPPGAAGPGGPAGAPPGGMAVGPQQFSPPAPGMMAGGGMGAPPPGARPMPMTGGGMAPPAPGVMTGGGMGAPPPGAGGPAPFGGAQAGNMQSMMGRMGGAGGMPPRLPPYGAGGKFGGQRPQPRPMPQGPYGGGVRR